MDKTRHLNVNNYAVFYSNDSIEQLQFLDRFCLFRDWSYLYVLHKILFSSRYGYVTIVLFIEHKHLKFNRQQRS